MATRKKGKVTAAKPKEPRRLLNARDNKVIVQAARGKTVRQNAYIVNVRVQPQSQNMLGMVRPMNPNVHTIAIPSQAPLAYPSVVVNRASAMERLKTPESMTVTNNPTYQATPMGSPIPTPMGSPMPAPMATSMPTSMATPMSAFMSSTPTSRRMMTPATRMAAMAPTYVNNRAIHMEAYQNYENRFKLPNESQESKRALLAMASAVADDTNSTVLMQTLNANRAGKFYQNLYDALRLTLYTESEY